jgi:hypothetical protein
MDGLVDDAITAIREFDDVFREGSLEEKKEFVGLFLDGIEVDPKKRIAQVRIKKFPAPTVFGTGNHLLAVVAGARAEPQKTPFPPIQVVEIPLVAKGNILVPAAA